MCQWRSGAEFYSMTSESNACCSSYQILIIKHSQSSSIKRLLVYSIVHLNLILLRNEEYLRLIDFMQLVQLSKMILILTPLTIFDRVIIGLYLQEMKRRSDHYIYL